MNIRLKKYPHHEKDSVLAISRLVEDFSKDKAFMDGIRQIKLIICYTFCRINAFF